MAKFRVKLKLQGLELEIEGSREDAPLIAQNLGRQFAGLLQPAAQIVAGNDDVPLDAAPIAIQEPDAASTVRKRGPRKKRGAPPAAAASDSAEEVPLDWRHDPAKWGSPKQAWNTANKAMWLLYVASNETDQKELSSKRIANTFNKHFKQAGQILPFNVTRDLGKLKIGKDAPVSEDTTQTSSPWFLTEAGTKRAQGLVSEALGRTAGEQEENSGAD
ncbi:MAG TPA: hypothetical protein VN706_01700 [Gemmatimonadaceae bacterium]|nr:hypothetical protein [Gemmatimonadaceae bacterium]